jgi:LPS O-antigen subunit length determinant protein (WzzB/FepE family)
VLENTRRTKTNKKNDNKNKLDTKDKEDNMSELIGENTFLKLRQQKDQMKAELEQVKIQRDIALRKLNKALQIAKDLRKLVENGTETK